MAEGKHGRNKSKCTAYRTSGRREANKARRKARDARRRVNARDRMMRAIGRAHELVTAGTVQLQDGGVAKAESMFVTRKGQVRVVLARDGSQPRRDVPVSELTVAPRRSPGA